MTLLRERLANHWLSIFQGVNLPLSSADYVGRLLEVMRVGEKTELLTSYQNHWSEKDVVLITYGDSIQLDGKKPLSLLHAFLNTYCQDIINSVHILPFFPFSSDDGFSVIDYFKVNEQLGSWEEIEKIASDYQVDFDFSNPEVLIKFVSIIRHYLDRGIRIFRLDAVAFIWKQRGTGCIHLPQAHDIVKLLRCLIEHSQRDVVIVTETNVPTKENLTYFGKSDEANWVYNFPLPPLLIYTLLKGNSSKMSSWLMSMPQAGTSTAYFNFIASHDGIGLRPVEDLLDDDEIFEMVKAMQDFGGQVSYRSSEKGVKPYEVNISLINALAGTVEGVDDWSLERFVCAHAIMFSLEGVPGLYIHSLLGTENDCEKLTETGHNRSINRHCWDALKLESALGEKTNSHRKVYDKIQNLLKIRTVQPAFHPNVQQFTLGLGDHLFGIWRQSIDKSQSIFSVSNITKEKQNLALGDLNLPDLGLWIDLLNGEVIQAGEQSFVLEPYQTVWLANKQHQLDAT